MVVKRLYAGELDFSSKQYTGAKIISAYFIRRLSNS